MVLPHKIGLPGPHHQIAHAEMLLGVAGRPGGKDHIRPVSGKKEEDSVSAVLPVTKGRTFPAPPLDQRSSRLST